MSLPSEICFVVESNDYRVRSSKLCKTSKYFSDLLDSSSEFSEVRLLLPDWISTRPFQVYLSYIENSRLPKVDSVMAQKLLWIADFFKDASLQSNLITQQIIPFLNKETVLLFVQDSSTKLQSTEEICDCWYELYTATCDFSAKNIEFLYEKFPNALEKLEKNAMKNILERALPYANKNFVYEKLLKITNSEGIVDLMTILEKDALLEFQKNALKNIVIDWNIEDFEFSNFYKESGTFVIGTTEWVLCVWCFEHEKRLEISIKQLEVSKDLKQNISAVTSIVQLQDEVLENLTAQVQAIPAYFQTQNIIREIKDFHPEAVQHFSIRLYAKHEEALSGILMKFVSDPKILIENDISNLPRSIFSVVLASKFLNVESEDLALEILGKWVESNHGTLVDENYAALAECIKWDFVTVKGVVNCLTNFPNLGKNTAFKMLFRKTFEDKLKKFNKELGETRKSYKKNVVKESFNNHKEYLGSLFEILLNLEIKSQVKESQPVKKMKNFEGKLQSAEKELEILKNGNNEVISPIPEIKVIEEDVSVNFTPANKSIHYKSRNSSVDTFINRSMDLTSKIRTRRAGAAIGDLVTKLRSTRKLRGQT